MNNTIIQKGDIFYANLGETVGSEQSGIRPVLVIQNNVGNKYSPTLIITPLTSKAKKLAQPTHVIIGKSFGLTEYSYLRSLRSERNPDTTGSIRPGMGLSTHDGTFRRSFSKDMP